MPNPITPCTVADFHQILHDCDQFWDREAVRALHHPMFVHEFGDTAFVIRDGDTVTTYLLGLFSQTAPIAYVHLVGVRQSQRRQGLASRLYWHFEEIARKSGCTHLKAITTPQNVTSIRFHQGLGFHLTGDFEVDGITVAKDYSGVGQHRVVIRKKL